VPRCCTGNLDIPRNDADAAAVWEGENDANAETSPTFDRIQLSPNRLGAFTDISKQVMVQSSIDMENFIRRRLNFAIAKALDYAALNGSGSGNQPLGILGTSGIGSVVGGTNGATPDWADIVDLESALTTDNADLGRLGYLTTPGVRGYLKKTLLDAGSGQFIWPQNATEINGYNVGTSTQVPSDLTKGSATAICHAIIFGNWEDLIIAQWGGLDIVVDPYSGSKNALVTLVVNSWWDTAVRHPESFAAMKDALIS
jgi:HK97 family phage major capsid protein